MPKELKALRGATTLQSDTYENMVERLGELMSELVNENKFQPADIVSILFTSTPDIRSGYPAAAARAACSWLSDIPLMGAQEIEIESGPPLCLRVLIHFYTRRAAKCSHIYLHGAKNLRKHGSNQELAGDK